jgi:hypothetical protein
MGWTPRRVFACLVVAAIVAGAPEVGAAAPLRDPQRIERAVGYIASHQKPNGSVPAFSPIGSTADAVVSFVAAGSGRPQVRRALGFLRRRVKANAVDTIGLQAKVTIALVASGRSPRDFGGLNLVKALRRSILPSGRFGDAPVFDDALATLALAGVGIAVPQPALDWLLAAQCPDGGWQYDEPAGDTEDEHCRSTTDPDTDFFASDTNTTSYVVQALEAGSAVDPAFAADPFEFFASIRDAGFGGWGYSWGVETTDANSTALVIQAYAAVGLPVPDGAMKALRALQFPRCGAWAFTWTDQDGGPVRDGPNVGATIGAVLGLLRLPLPVTGATHGPAADTPACSSA